VDHELCGSTGFVLSANYLVRRPITKLTRA